MPPNPPDASFPLKTTAAEPDPALSPQELGSEDFYMDGPYLVFTAAYHRKRGFCCGSGCRHCPYGYTE